MTPIGNWPWPLRRECNLGQSRRYALLQEQQTAADYEVTLEEMAQMLSSKIETAFSARRAVCFGSARHRRSF